MQLKIYQKEFFHYLYERGCLFKKHRTWLTVANEGHPPATLDDAELPVKLDFDEELKIIPEFILHLYKKDKSITGDLELLTNNKLMMHHFSVLQHFDDVDKILLELSSHTFSLNDFYLSEVYELLLSKNIDVDKFIDELLHKRDLESDFKSTNARSSVKTFLLRHYEHKPQLHLFLDLFPDISSTQFKFNSENLCESYSLMIDAELIQEHYYMHHDFMRVNVMAEISLFHRKISTLFKKSHRHTEGNTYYLNYYDDKAIDGSIVQGYLKSFLEYRKHHTEHLSDDMLDAWFERTRLDIVEYSDKSRKNTYKV